MPTSIIDGSGGSTIGQRGDGDPFLRLVDLVEAKLDLRNHSPPRQSRSPEELVEECREILNGARVLDDRAERLADLLIELTSNTGFRPVE